ncbi:MAG: AAA family ATPase [Sphingobacterium sp.]|uniref:AAA family ATPase n=1 Tax=Sphingobacterium sp. JB170 TaxID=1434842 RepID=UPI00097EAE0A|nr:AAA family ATPase [Sphingobacterium sp. JB170]SJN43783.1 hypothetical protein FM107_12495 [Sphingobacterium sp. JB170]
MKDNFYVITGGPGSGKTTLLNELNKKKFQTIPEDARRIIKEQIKFQGLGLPWKDKVLYATLMFNESIKTYQKIRKENPSGIIFFDRGVLDTVCYFIMENIPIPKKMAVLINEVIYNRKVFVLPPWKEIYENDGERKQKWEEAVTTFERMKEIYIHYGYNLVEVPVGTIENRLKFVLDEIR